MRIDILELEGSLIDAVADLLEQVMLAFLFVSGRLINKVFLIISTSFKTKKVRKATKVSVFYTRIIKKVRKDNKVSVFSIRIIHWFPGHFY